MVEGGIAESEGQQVREESEWQLMACTHSHLNLKWISSIQSILLLFLKELVLRWSVIGDLTILEIAVVGANR